MKAILKFVPVLLAALLVSGCCADIQKKAVDDLEATHALIFPEYLKLVEKEHAGSPDKIANRKGLVKSAGDIVSAMKKMVEK